MTITDDAATPNRVAWQAPDAAVWSLETAHGSSIASEPLRAAMEDGFAAGFRRSFAALGLPLSHIEIRHVHGWPYTSVFAHGAPRKPGTPPPAFVLKVLTRVHPGFRQRTKVATAAIRDRVAEGWADDWAAERQGWIDRILALQRRGATDMDGIELAAHLRGVESLVSDALRRHFELVVGSVPLGHWFVRTADWGLPRAEARQAVMYGTPVHDEARRRLQRIAAARGEATPSSLDELREHSPEAAAAVDDYLANHGWWATEDRVDSLRLLDHPDLILATVMATRTASPAQTETEQQAPLAALRAQVPSDFRGEFDRLAGDAQRAHAMLEDNSGILGSWVTGVAGHALRTAAEYLHDHGVLDHPDHVWALPIDEITGLLDGGRSITAAEIAGRYEAWQAQAALDPPAHLNGEPSGPPDAAVFPAPVGRMVAAVSAFLDDKFNYAGSTIGIGDGSVQGRAVVVANASEAFDRLEPGDILVTGATTPAYNNVLPLVAGIIVTEGGLSCHAAIVARELGVPALVGLRNALTTIPDGAIIELDAARARVTVL